MLRCDIARSAFKYFLFYDEGNMKRVSSIHPLIDRLMCKSHIMYSDDCCALMGNNLLQSVGTEGDSHANMSCRDESDYVISVMLPSKEQAESGFTQLDKVYVVVLKPNKRYTMYSCELPRSIFV